MPPAPLVSIVMPSFNHAKFILASIDSVLGQDYPNLELIVGDGGSSDGTVELLRKKSEADPRLRWFSRKDSGPADALNTAFAMIRGTVVGWLNSDDLYPPGAVRRAVNALETHPDWIMVYGKGEHVDVDGKFINAYPTLPPSTPAQRFSDGCFICQPTVFFKSAMFLLLGNLDKSLKAAFDFDYWLRAFLTFPERIGFIDEVQAQSRLHDECITVRMRRRVALEGARVVARHLGEAPIHWLTTYIEELLAQPPEARNITDLQAHLLAMAREARGNFGQSDLDALEAKIETDPRFTGKSPPPPRRPGKNGTGRNASGNLAHLEKAYLEVAHDLVCDFYGTIKSNPGNGESHGGKLVGLLTFPNSGTSWFLQLSQAATRIRNHTVYEHESLKTRGEPNRGAYILNTPNIRSPESYEPSLVKSHVAHYGEESVARLSLKRFDALCEEWMKSLPPNCRRYIRLVRNPFDNLRGRYHLYLKLHAGQLETELFNFRQFFQHDFRRYLLWHAYCDKAASKYPIMSLHYADLLNKDKSSQTFLKAMNFAGYEIDMQDVERAYKQSPPIYVQKKHIPVHLQYFSEEDIHWMAEELKKWLAQYPDILSLDRGPISMLKDALRR